MNKNATCWVSALCLIGFPLATAAQENFETDEPILLGTIFLEGAKRTQDVLTFPGTVIQADAEALEARSVRRINDLDRIFPGVAIDAQSARAYTNISVRGASSLDFYNPSVQVYVDGVPQDAGSLGQMLSGELDTVELLYPPLRRQVLNASFPKRYPAQREPVLRRVAVHVSLTHAFDRSGCSNHGTPFKNNCS